MTADDLEKTIEVLCLQNAIKFDGKCNPGAIVGGIIKLFPDKKSDIPALKKIIDDIAAKVNDLSLEDQEIQLEALGAIETKQKRQEGLKPLNNAIKGQVVMRFEPSPSGPLHVGHAFSFMLNAEYCSLNDGHLILRVADTNQDNIYEQAYDLIEEDGKWLSENQVKEFFWQSDRLEMYYTYAVKLLEEGHAYICRCEAEEFKKLRDAGKACPCRDLDKETQMERWEMMHKTYRDGDAVMRIKTDIAHKNPAMRDWPVMRINTAPHPKQGDKFRIWPLMNFSVVVDDIEGGLTHILRGKDHADNAKKQEYVYNYLGKPIPETIFVGKINFEGLPLSATKTREAIEEGKFTGWDDIRLPFIPALRRRGYQPQAFRQFAVSVGVTQNDKTVSGDDFFKSINHLNKQILEPKAKRYFAVRDPVELKIEGAEEQEIELDLHPDNQKGGRKFTAKDEFLVEKEDLERFSEGQLVRFMECLNFEKKGDSYTQTSTDYEDYQSASKKMIIHYLPKDADHADVEIHYPDGTVVAAKGEAGLQDVQIGDVIQLERIGFCRLDGIKGDKLAFWFAHK